MNISLSQEDKGVIVFHIWKSLPYNTRIILSFLLIGLGFYLQYSDNFFTGLVLIAAGNSLLLVKGYDNRIKLGKYSAAGEWVKTDKEHLEKILKLNKKIKKWDKSFIDITSPVGLGTFITIGILLFLVFIYTSEYYYYYLHIFSVDAMILLLPHWLSGLKRVTTTPLLVQKINIFFSILDKYKTEIEKLPAEIQYLIYVKGKDVKLPDDLKIKINGKQAPENFMGMYLQIAMNNVEGKNYPYFYSVLVAKKDLGLHTKFYDKIKINRPLIKEKSTEGDMEIIVIRQYTTKTSGYHTNNELIEKIFSVSLNSLLMILE